MTKAAQTIAKYAEQSIAAIKQKTKEFANGKSSISKNFSVLDKVEIKDITTDEKRNKLLDIVKTAKKEVKTFSNIRLQLTRPIDELKKTIMSEERLTIAATNSKISEIEVIIADYDYKVEAERLAKVAKLQAKQEEIERKQKEEIERIERGQELINDLNESIASEIGMILSQEDHPALLKLEKIYKSDLKKADEESFMHRVDDARAILNLAIDRIKSLKPQVKRLYDIKIKTEKAGALEKKRLEENAKIEKDKIAATQAAAAAAQEEEDIKQEKAQLDKERSVRALPDHTDELKEIEQQKLKSLTRGFEIEIEDIDMVPMIFIKKQLDTKKARSWIKENNAPISGTKVKLKNNEYL